MKLADEIKYCLMKWCLSNQSDLIIPNFYLNSHYEMDLFRMTKAGMVYEYEIKISRSDYKNDFKKQISDENNKHNFIKNGKRLCNYFYFIVPENLIKKDEIPDYCGLIYYIKEYKKIEIIKKAPILHKNKYTNYAELCEKLTYRANILQGKLRYIEYNLSLSNKTNIKLTNLLEKHNIQIPFDC